jgi:hypothetical protein
VNRNSRLPVSALIPDTTAMLFQVLAARDPVLVVEFEGGGLISYMRGDGTLMHTLNTPDGFRRKLRQLGVELKPKATNGIDLSPLDQKRAGLTMGDTSLSATIERLSNKLELLQKADRKLEVFGAGKPYGHEYRLCQASTADLEAIEKKAGQPLPEEYRAWVMQVGFGAGPYYGLLSPAKIPLPHDVVTLMERSEAHGGDLPSVKYLTTADVRGIADKWSQAGRAEHGISCDSDEGLLPITDEGCGGYSCIAVSGELVGRMFGTSMELREPRSAWIGIWPEGVARYVEDASGGFRFECSATNHFGFFSRSMRPTSCARSLRGIRVAKLPKLPK